MAHPIKRALQSPLCALQHSWVKKCGSVLWAASACEPEPGTEATNPGDELPPLGKTLSWMFKFGGLLGYSWGFSVVDNHTASATLKVFPADNSFCKKTALQWSLSLSAWAIFISPQPGFHQCQDCDGGGWCLLESQEDSAWHEGNVVMSAQQSGPEKPQACSFLLAAPSHRLSLITLSL